jgi:hypothetical protein
MRSPAGHSIFPHCRYSRSVIRNSWETSPNQPNRQFRPRFQGSRDEGEYQPHEQGSAQQCLLEDAAIFARTQNPNKVKRTMAICTGVFSRGTCAAAKILTGDVLRVTNQTELDRICGSVGSYGVLFRVPVYGTTTSMPDLRDRDLILHAWPQMD